MFFAAPVVRAFFKKKRALLPALFILVLASVPLASTGFANEIATARTGLDEAGNITIEELEFKNAQVQDAVRIVSELTGVNIVATGEAGKRLVTFFVRHLTVADIVDSICRLSGLWYRHNPNSGVFIVMTTEEYRKDMVVFRNEPVRMFQLKYLNVGIAARTIADLFGERVELGGRANSHLGDDYEHTGLVSAMGENLDDDDDESDGTGSRRSRSGTSSRNRGNRYDDSARSGREGDEEINVLTPAQLALLEQKVRTELQMVPEGMLGQVSRRTAPTIYVTVNRLHNMLFVRTADEKALEEIARIIRDSDQQVPEVLLEMKVLEVQLTDQFESAFDISRISGSTETGPDDGHVTNPLNAAATSVGRSLLGLGNFEVNDNSTLTFQILSEDLRVRLQLLQQNNNISSLATPMLLAANNHPARLFIGEETVLTTGFKTLESTTTTTTGVVVNNSLPVPVTEVRSVGNTLTILPSINADRSVVMRIVHENSSVNPNGGRIPLPVGNTVQTVFIDTVNTSTLEGTVLAQDGMTVAVGGMMRTNLTDAESKVPVLGDIPGFGFFFKRQQKIKTKTELVLLITPHILSAPEQGEAVTRKRLHDLTEHPNGIDAYLESLDRERAAAAKNRAGERPLVGAALADVPADPGGGLERSFVELIRTAAIQVRQPVLLRQPVGAIRPAPLPALGEAPIFSHRGITSTPIAAWSDGHHFVTALKVLNRTGRVQRVDVADLRGDWPAATLERQELAPAGQEGDFTWLYLISDTSFENFIAGEIRP